VLVCPGPVRNGDLFEITFSSDNSINSTGFYATYHVINSSMMTSSPDQPVASGCKRGTISYGLRRGWGAQANPDLREKWPLNGLSVYDITVVEIMWTKLFVPFAEWHFTGTFWKKIR